jgi:Uma2 family endonuclease
VTAEMVAPAWMHEQVSAEQYAMWTEEQCAGIEIVDGMVVVSPSASKRHNRLARIIANALDAAAGPEWNADTAFDVRLQDVPLNNRRPDVTVYRADTIDLTPTRPEHVLLVVEVLLPGRRPPTGPSRRISTPRQVSRSIGGSNMQLPVSRSSTPMCWIRLPAATGTATSLQEL